MEEALLAVEGHQTRTLIDTSASPDVTVRERLLREPEPERSRAKLASRRAANEFEGMAGSNAAERYFMSEALVDDADDGEEKDGGSGGWG